MQMPVLISLLDQLTRQLKVNELWSSKPISAPIIHRAETEGVPFACNVMPFEHWLQFIFIPRMLSLIESEEKLPNFLCLLPAAQEGFSHAKYAQLLAIIAAIDEQFSRHEEY